MKNQLEIPNGPVQTASRDLRFWIDRFLAKIKDLSQNYQFSIRSNLNLLTEYTSSHGISKAEQIRGSDVRSLFETMLRSRKFSSVASIYATLRKFIDFLIESGAIECSKDPLKGIKLSSFRDWVIHIPPEHALTSDESDNAYKAILANAKSILNSEARPNKYRDYAMVMILAEHGLFPTQLLKLRMEQLDINYKSGEGVIRNISEGRKRTLYDVVLSRKVIEAIRLYIDKERGTESGYLFPGRNAQEMYRGRISEITKGLSGWTPREIRQMLVRRLHRMKLSAVEIAQRLNCSNLARCAQYL